MEMRNRRHVTEFMSSVVAADTARPGFRGRGDAGADEESRVVPSSGIGAIPQPGRGIGAPSPDCEREWRLTGDSRSRSP